MLNNVDKIEKVLYRSGKFNVKNVIIVGSKNNVTGVRIDSIHTRTYQSNKYVGIPNLSTININTSEFISFHYNDYENKINEEVYLSYPHMLSVLDFFDQVLNLVYTEGLYTNNGINPAFYVDGAAPMITSDYFGGNKFIDFVPSKIMLNDGTSKDGGLLTLNNNANAFVELDIKALETIDYILRNINLGSYSNQTLMIAMLEQLGNNSGSSNNGFVQQQYTNSYANQQQQTYNNANNKNGARRRGVTVNRQRNYGGTVNNTAAVNQQVVNSPLPEEDDMPVETPDPIKRQKSSNKMISMDDILNTADEIEVDLDEIDM